MEIPDLVREELGDEELRAGVPIGDEDVVCATPSRTLVYNAEGLLSDERVDAFPHDADRLELTEGRRKTTFEFTYVDGTRSFSVPGDHTRDVLTLLLEGILKTHGVIAAGESVVGAFRFSELTLVIAEDRLIRHIGATVWDDDFQTYAYEDLTGLAFEEGSVATELVVWIDGRPQRIKTPRDDARLVEETLKTAVFEYYDVATLAELDRIVGVDDDPETTPDGNDLGLGSDIDPLVAEGDATESPAEPATDTDAGTDVEATPPTSNPDQTEPQQTEQSAAETSQSVADDSPIDTDIGDGERGSPDRNDESLEVSAEPDPAVATAKEVEELREQMDELSTAVDRQNQLLKKQHNAIKELVEQLRNQ
ncbi:hypothetical protein [Halorhabdus sp. CUG00001]|uniref:DUF7115 domain-containing protein n=1 Tax=Halorhabdus sp. CUG00001 TaxID=2600297 RepID=UPI00131E6AD3|nr:hypothetical protein [Halorhabdus sp. CUG00001]